MRSACLMLLTVALLPAQTKTPAADWPSYNRDLAATRFSPLTQINSGNVAKLAVAWSYALRPEASGPPAATFNQVTPIVVNGVMYLPAGNRVVALDADTGKEIWRYDLKSGVASQRGVAYWPGDPDSPPRILFLTGHKMVGLNAHGQARPRLRPGRRTHHGRSLCRRSHSLQECDGRWHERVRAWRAESASAG